MWLLLQDSVFDPMQTAEPKSIYLSRDGGINFQRMIVETASSPFSAGGTTLYAHVSNRDVLYFSFGSFVTQTSYFYRYDAGAQQLTTQTWPYSDGEVGPIAFSPVDARYLYLGMSRNEPTSAQGK